MKISGNRGPSGAGGIKAGRGTAQKDIGSLSKGDTFTATVAGVSGGEVSLNLAGGGTFTAKSRNTAGLAKGMQLSFTVEANENGQVYVRMSAVGSENVSKIAAKALSDAGLALNEKNIETAKALIENGITLDSDKLHKASYGMTLESMTPEKLLFFLKEGIDINEGSLKQLNDNVLNRGGLEAKLNALIKEMDSLPENTQKLAAALIFGETSKEKPFASSMKKAFFIDVEKDGKKLNEGYFKKIYGAVSTLLSGLSETEETKTLLSAAKNIKDALEFQNEIKSYKYYLQIPFVFEGKTGQGELYVFKDPKKKESLQKSVTALLCLNLANLGRVEAFIVKTGKNVSCTFGLSEQAIEVFKGSSFELFKLLAQKGFKLEQVDFRRADGAFNLLRDNVSEQKKLEKTQVYSFDARA